MILTGGVMQVRDSVVSTLGSQTDMVATLFGQLGMDASAYRYSKDLLRPNVVPFAFYAYSNAAAVVVPEGTYVLDLRTQKSVDGQINTRLDELVKVYLQAVDADLKK